MKILYIPLDERPCNYVYPQMISTITKECISFITPPKTILGDKKKPGDVEKIWAFILDNVAHCDYAIINIETLVYGGLLPSRLHHMALDVCSEKLYRIKKIKEINPNIKIYLSSLIMRTPQYNSSDEEPDYYEAYGLKIFKHGYYEDKKLRAKLTDGELKELDDIKKSVPLEYIHDYESRRAINAEVNKLAIELVKDEYVEFMCIPQDDAAEYGYTAIDQKKVLGKVVDNRLQHKILTYPGADEVGCTLLARAFNDYYQVQRKFYVFYSSTLGPQIIPKYEDRPIHESLKSHILAVNGSIVQNIDDADIVLAVNTPGKFMEEARNQKEKDITYTSFRNLRVFTSEIKTLVNMGKKVLVCDSAFSNGGDIELIRMLDDIRTLDKIYGYAGWNTNCNTLGTVIATGVMASKSYNRKAIDCNLIFRIMEDLIYQSIVRYKIVDYVLPKLGATWGNFCGKEEQILNIKKEELLKEYHENIIHSFQQYTVDISDINSPWHRMFEIGLTISID